MVILASKDEEDLLRIARKTKGQGAKVALFREPDIEMQATALAILPDNEVWKSLASLPLAMRGR